MSKDDGSLRYRRNGGDEERQRLSVDSSMGWVADVTAAERECSAEVRTEGVLRNNGPVKIARTRGRMHTSWGHHRRRSHPTRWSCPALRAIASAQAAAQEPHSEQLRRSKAEAALCTRPHPHLHTHNDSMAMMYTDALTSWTILKPVPLCDGASASSMAFRRSAQPLAVVTGAAVGSRNVLH